MKPPSHDNAAPAAGKFRAAATLAAWKWKYLSAFFGNDNFAQHKRRVMAMRKLVLASLCLCYPMLAAAQSLDGKTIVMSGNGHGVPACASCHGAQGQGGVADGAPMLAGIPEVAIVGLLSWLAKGGGDSLIMQNYASELKPDEIAAVARYFSSLPIPNQ